MVEVKKVPKPIYRCRDGHLAEGPAVCREGAELLLDPSRRLHLSKTMTAILRHIPWEVGLTLDKEGWVSIDRLVDGIKGRWRRYSWVTANHVLAIALLDPKGRFEVKDGRIRARYGHSVPVNIKYEEDVESRVLYHGTPQANLRKIMVEGLIRGGRLWVHLTISPTEALDTGLRHGRSVAVLSIDADCLRSKGIKIFKASEIVRLATHVPPECLSVVKVLR